MLRKLLATIASSLDEAGIRYMVIGGQAVIAHGFARVTEDIDITLGCGPERLQELLAIAARQNWSVMIDEPVPFVQDTMVLPCCDDETGIRIEFIFSFTPYEQIALDRIERKSIGGAEVAFVCAEDLIVHKMVAGRPRDLEDIRVVLLKNPNTDLVYVEKWLRDFESVVSRPLVEEFHVIRDSNE